LDFALKKWKKKLFLRVEREEEEEQQQQRFFNNEFVF